MPCAPVWSMPPNIIFNDTMNSVATLIIYQLIFFLLAGASAVILLVYKKQCLNRMRNSALRYMLGLLMAYGLLFLVLILNRESELVHAVFQRTYLFPHLKGVGVYFILMPAIYSVFLLEYEEKGGRNASWNDKLKLMASVSINAMGAFFGLLFANFLLDGHSFGELVTTTKEAFCCTEWWAWPLLIVTVALFVWVVKYDHDKHHPQRRSKKRTDNAKTR